MFLLTGIRPLGTKYGPFSIKRPKRLEQPGPPFSHSNSGADFPSWLLSYIRLINHFNSKWLKNLKKCYLKLIYHSGQKLDVLTIFDTFLEEQKLIFELVVCVSSCKDLLSTSSYFTIITLKLHHALNFFKGVVWTIMPIQKPILAQMSNLKITNYKKNISS